MNALIVLLFAADPTGLQAAFESAETVDLSYDWTGFKVTLVNPETVKKLAPLVEVKGEARNFPPKSGFLTHEIIRVTLHSGKKTTEFWMVENSIVREKKLFALADNKLWLALRAYFEPPRVEPPKGLPGDIPGPTPPPPPTIEEVVAKTLTAAMKSADKLHFLFRGGKTEIGLHPKMKEVWLGNLKSVGEVTRNAKKPEDAVEIVFWNQETKTSIFFVGDTAFWGDKRFNSVKLTRDSMWKQVLEMVRPVEEAPKPADTSGLAAAIESADSIEAIRVGGETESRKGTLKLKKDELQGLAKLALVTGKPVSHHGKDDPDSIDLVVTKGKDSTRFRLIGDTLVFDKDRSIKMEHDRLWASLFQKLQKSDQ